MLAKSVFNSRNLLYAFILFIGSTMSLGAIAQATNQAIYLPPGQSNQGAPPAPGDGPSSAIVVPGDTQTQNAPTGKPTSSPEYGTNFPHQAPLRRSRINLLVNGKVGLTFQPDQLTNEQSGKVRGIIPGMSANEPYQNISVSLDQLKKMQDALAPYPTTGNSAVPMPKPTRNGVTQRSQIFADGPASSRLSQNGTNGVTPALPVLRQFCRYLVILGVVCACIFMAFSAVGLQFGDRNAGARIIGSAGGIMLLLMGYAIWKVVRFNENNARGPQVVDLSHPPPMLDSLASPGDKNRSKGDDSFVSTANANLPVTPGNQGSVQRSGLPLKPLGSAH